MKKIKIFLLFFIIIILTSGLSALFLTKKQNYRAEVVFWTVQLAPFSDYINSVIGEFEQTNPDIKIKWIDVPYAEVEKRVLASLLSNSMPDLINITSDFNRTLATKGALQNIESGFAEYNDALVSVLSYQDKVWGIPFYATSAITVYNKELMNKFGFVTPPSDYDELISQLNNSKIIPNKYLFMPTLTENDTLYKLLNKYNINSPQTLDTEKSFNLFSNLKELYLVGKIPKESISQTHREVLEKYSAGQIAYLQIGANFLNIIRENSLDVYNKTDVAAQFSGNDKTYDFSLMTLAIPKKAKHKDEALLFAKFITNASNQLEFAKKTGVLPCNKKTLSDEFFTKYDEKDLYSKARAIGAMQLSKPTFYSKDTKNYREITTLLNNLIETILLEDKDIKSLLADVSGKWLLLNSK